ncbi:hypothetical protein NC652_015464 [Populus alba x Populus x berolinensis]|nr:hypothetical protein NC652_015464 [Populus alba x Populus x berolinensis]
MERIEATRELHIVHITMSFWLRMKSKKKRKEYRVEAKAARGTRLVEKQKKEEVKPHSCNSRWKQGKGGEVWCNDGFPRLVQRPQEIALTEKMIACFKEDQVHFIGSFKSTERNIVFPFFGAAIDGFDKLPMRCVNVILLVYLHNRSKGGIAPLQFSRDAPRCSLLNVTFR